MLWLNPHRRFLRRLSVYIDGELSPAQTRALEAHLADCQPCRLELDQLRATVRALRELPQEDVPRSFALTRQQAALPVPPPTAPRREALSAGMRLAGAALAFALAAVFVVDLADLDGGGGERAATQQEQQLGFTAPLSEAQRAPAPTTQMDAAAKYFASSPSAAATPVPDGGVPAGPAGLPQLTPLPEEPAATAAPAPIPSPREGEADLAALAPPPTQDAGERPSLAADGDGGLDALRAAEIALALALGLTLAGVVALAFAARRR